VRDEEGREEVRKDRDGLENEAAGADGMALATKDHAVGVAEAQAEEAQVEEGLARVAAPEVR